MALLTRLTGSTVALQRWTVASLIANMAIIVTGAVVRLTGSGLGCPTWPQCSDGAYTPRGEISHHKLIEFGNRTLTFVLLAIAVFCLVAAHKASRDRLVRTLAWVVAAGIPFQGVIGGITVLTDLNPFVVALHLLLSLALVVILVKLTFLVHGHGVDEVSRGLRASTLGAFIAMSMASWLGTVVTGSGPHAGDGGAARTGFDIETVARVHAVSAWATVVLVVLTLMWATRARAARVQRWATVLLVATLLQGALGYYQYFNGLPIGVVLGHLAGASIAVASAAAVLFSNRRADA